MNDRKDLEYYLALPYTIEIRREDDETWFARVVELPGCMTEGDTAEEAAAMIRDAMAAWLEVALDEGRSVPEPRPLDEYSGRFVVRVPRSLHRDLVESAEREGVSLNQYVIVALARAAGGPPRSSPVRMIAER
ncbi:MAG: type II toxin-antitoxin system HicB family antitoxin [Ardenticatenaceae bacterium]|nr:type II toxin-antitoxin system HicB family antitoxin [Ardenticatenaceae bacterium]